MPSPRSPAAISTHTLPKMGERRFNRINGRGLWTLYLREVRRFFKVYAQTLLAPMATSALYMTVFTFALAARRGDIWGMHYSAFLAPGVVMMAIMQNAFANTSASITISKVQGNIVDTLMPPLSAGEMTAGFALGGATRGVMVAACVSAVLFPFVEVGIAHPLWAIYFASAGALMLSLAGLAAGIWSEKFDQIAAVTNFVITPLSFLSGTFYTVDSLPQNWRALSHWNPFFYLIDGFRYAVIGRSDADPLIGLGVSLAVIGLLWTLCWRLFALGYKLKE